MIIFLTLTLGFIGLIAWLEHPTQKHWNWRHEDEEDEDDE